MKRLATFLCAFLLAFSVPATAFGEENNEAPIKIEPRADVYSDLGSTISDPTDSVFISQNANLSANGVVGGKIVSMRMVVNNTTALGDNLWVMYPRTATAPKPYAISVNQSVLEPAVAFRLEFADKDGNTLLEPTDGGSMDFVYEPRESLIDELATKYNISKSDIKLYIYERDTNGDILRFVSGAATTPAAHVQTTDLRSGIYVMALACDSSLLKDKPISPKPTSPTPTVTFTSDDDSSSESSTWRDLQVTGSNEVSAQGYLFGSNASDGDDAYLSIRRLTSGSAFNTLRAAAGGNGLNKAFDVTLYVNGKEVHSDFGRVRLSFAVGSQYNGRKATVWHLHNNGELTSEDTWVIDGAVSIEASDLSEFGIDIEGVAATADQIDDGTTSPKTGQTTSAATAPAALLVATALGAAALAARRRVR